jgi:hypothetical protein
MREKQFVGIGWQLTKEIPVLKVTLECAMQMGQVV